MNKHCQNIELKQFLRSFDIICLCETWGKIKNEFDNFLDSYFHYDHIRNMVDISIRNSGGVSVFISNALYKLNIIERIYEKLEDCVVLSVKLSKYYQCKDLILYFTYISPEGSNVK